MKLRCDETLRAKGKCQLAESLQQEPRHFTGPMRSLSIASEMSSDGCDKVEDEQRDETKNLRRVTDYFDGSRAEPALGRQLQLHYKRRRRQGSRLKPAAQQTRRRKRAKPQDQKDQFGQILAPQLR